MFKVDYKDTTTIKLITIKKTVNNKNSSQSAFTCSTLTLETLEQGVKFVQS